MGPDRPKWPTQRQELQFPTHPILEQRHNHPPALWSSSLQPLLGLSHRSQPRQLLSWSRALAAAQEQQQQTQQHPTIPANVKVVVRKRRVQRQHLCNAVFAMSCARGKGHWLERQTLQQPICLFLFACAHLCPWMSVLLFLEEDINICHEQSCHATVPAKR